MTTWDDILYSDMIHPIEYGRAGIMNGFPGINLPLGQTIITYLTNPDLKFLTFFIGMYF